MLTPALLSHHCRVREHGDEPKSNTSVPALTLEEERMDPSDLFLDEHPSALLWSLSLS